MRIGEHLDKPDDFKRWYREMTEGFLCLPLYFPGTQLWRAVQARKNVVTSLTAAVRRSKEAMARPGAEPRCLLDFWSARMLEIIKEVRGSRRLCNTL